MNHKRGRPKSRRAGCMMCKSYKHQGFGKEKSKHEIHGTGGFGKLRAEIAAEADAMDDPSDRFDAVLVGDDDEVVLTMSPRSR